MTVERPDEGHPKEDAAPVDGKKWTVRGLENSGKGPETENDELRILKRRLRPGLNVQQKEG